jgi:hypothetical protein
MSEDEKWFRERARNLRGQAEQCPVPEGQAIYLREAERCQRMADAAAALDGGAKK